MKFFARGEGANLRGAYLRASKKPRFSDNALRLKIRKPEALTPIGSALYGFTSWKELE